jgi:hypothetical protein
MARRLLGSGAARRGRWEVINTHGLATGDYSFPYIATWADADGAGAVQATQARVATAARLIIEASPAPHDVGGRPQRNGDIRVRRDWYDVWVAQLERTSALADSGEAV